MPRLLHNRSRGLVGWVALFSLVAVGCGRIGFAEVDVGAHDADVGDARDAGEPSDSAPLDADAAAPTDGATDAGPDATLPRHTATHGGWVEVSAVERSDPRTSSSPVPSEALRVDLAWAPIEVVPAAAAEAYRVLRSTALSGPYGALGDVVPLDPLPTRFVDLTASPGVTHYYRVQPVVEGVAVSSTGTDATLMVHMPSGNRAFVHRWMANRAVCELLGRPVDRDNDYRCDYTGPGRIAYAGDVGAPPAAESFYDIGAHYLVDVAEMGCSYTAVSSGCPDDAGGPGPCLGIGAAAPDAPANAKGGNAQVGNDGDVFYDRGSSVCWTKTGAGWTAASAAGTTTADRLRMTSNSPGLPPLVLIGQGEAAAVCRGRIVGGRPGRLMTRKVQIAVSAWPAALSPAEITALESGAGPSDCNTDLGHGLVFDTTIEPTTDWDTLPGTTVNTFRTLRTGSIATTTCRSRFGIQDLTGNVWEWVSDQFVSSAAGLTLTGVVSALEPTNRDLEDIVFTRALGGGGGEWAFEAATHLLPAVGVPSSDAAPAWHDASLIASVHTAEDEVFMDEAFVGPRGVYVGGSSSSGTRGGRFALNVSRTPSRSDVHGRIGFRCVVRLAP